MASAAPAVAINPSNKDTPFSLSIDAENRCYHVFDLNIKCSTDALKTFHRCSDAILERDPELHNIWIDDHRFYSHAIIEVIENELSSLHHKCLFSNLKPLQGFRWLEGLCLVIGSYLKYLNEFDDRDRLDALLNLFYAAWITFFIHNRYAILTLTCPAPPPDANNNDDDCIIIDNQEKKVRCRPAWCRFVTFFRVDPSCQRAQKRRANRTPSRQASAQFRSHHSGSDRTRPSARLQAPSEPGEVRGVLPAVAKPAHAQTKVVGRF